MKIFLIVWPLLVFFACTELPNPATTSGLDWTEPADPQGERPEAWTNITEPVVTFGSTDVRYPRSTPYADDVSESHTLAGWRGEKVSAQIVVSTPDSIGGLQCRIGDFQTAAGTPLRDIARARFVT